MFNHPRRPYYNYRAEDVPSESTSQVNSMDAKRFWKLVDQLKRRQNPEKHAEDDSKKPASTGKA